jgi:hypothetical protein
MEVVGGIAIAFVVVLLFIFHAEIEALIGFLIFGLAIPIGVLSFAFHLIGKGNQGAGGFLIGIVIIWWFIIGLCLKDEFFHR